MADQREFFDTLFQGVGKGNLYFMALDKPKSEGGKVVKQHWVAPGEKLPQLNPKFEWYFASATYKNGSRVKEQIAELPLLSVDIDDIKTVDELNARLMAVPYQPSAVVHSGGGFHVHWVLEQPTTDVDTFEKTLFTLIERLGADPGCKDAGHLFRVPLTLNHKKDNGPEPQQVKLLELNPECKHEVSALASLGGSRGQEKKGSVELLDGVQKGSRNSSLASVLGRWFRLGLTDGEVWDLACNWNERNQPPLVQPELKRTFDSIRKRHFRAVRPVIECPGIDCHTLMLTDYPEPRWAVPGLVPEGLTFFAGKPKHGKSILCLNLGLAIATGGSALSYADVEAGTVIYLALEDVNRRLKERCGKMLFDEQGPARLRLYTEWSRVHEGGLDKLVEEIQKYPDTRLVMIDTLAAFRAPTDSSKTSVYQADYDAGVQLKKAADELHVAFLVTHHLRKTESTDRFDDLSGSFGVTGSADGTIILARQFQQCDAELLVTGRDVEENKFALRFEKECLSWRVLGKADEIQSTENQQKIVELLKSSTEPKGPKTIAEETGIKEGRVKKVLPKLLENGQVIRDAKGKYQVPRD